MGVYLHAFLNSALSGSCEINAPALLYTGKRDVDTLPRWFGGLGEVSVPLVAP